MTEELTARSALGTATGAPPRAHGNHAAVQLNELAVPAMFDLRLDPVDAAAVSAAETALALKLPLTPNKSTAAGGCLALWFGPDQWLIVGPPDDAVPLMQTLAGRDASVVGVNDLRAVFELAGPASREVLRKGCAIDLHPRAFKPGDCALTVLARVPVALHQSDDRPGYQIFVERSYAEYLWIWLSDAMVEFKVD